MAWNLVMDVTLFEKLLLTPAMILLCKSRMSGPECKLSLQIQLCATGGDIHGEWALHFSRQCEDNVA